MIIEFRITPRSKYFNNPDATGFICYLAVNGHTIYERGTGSMHDEPFRTERDGAEFVELYGSNIIGNLGIKNMRRGMEQRKHFDMQPKYKIGDHVLIKGYPFRGVIVSITRSDNPEWPHKYKVVHENGLNSLTFDENSIALLEVPNHA